MQDFASMAGTGGSPNSNNNPSSSSPALFATDIASNTVELRNVILNEFHVLRKFLLISLCDQALRLTLDSDLSSQIGFQLNNENIDNTDESNGSEPTVATFMSNDFSELFNTVNLVTEVILQPRQVQQIIITFRPSELPKDASDHGGDFKEAQQDIQLASDGNVYENVSTEPSSKVVYPLTDQTFKVNGMIFLSASLLNDNMQTQLGSAGENILDNRQDIVIHFHSTVFRSNLKADVQDIVFDDCVPGGVFVKDFSIWNLSEIPCAFQLHVKSGQADQPALDLKDYDTGLSVASGDIKSCAHRRIRVMYKPRDVGDFSYSIQLENTFDERNSTCIPVQCIVNAEHRQEGLLVTGVGEDGVLDFGDCYSCNGTCQMLTLRNITQEALVVNLGTDHAPGDKVNFYLQTELDMSSAPTNNYEHDTKLLEDILPATEDEIDSTAPSHKLEDSVGTSVKFDEKNRIEELSLGRGEGKNLLVWFCADGASDETKAVRLQRRTFRLALKCEEKKGRSKQRFSNVIQCKARVCTSIVKLSTPELNFGDCNIGSHKLATVEIMNLSDLPALVALYVSSTVLSFKKKEGRVPIAPRQSYSLDIELVPLKINLTYRKQITINNFYNKNNQQTLEARAKIMDRHHVLLHSLFYKLRTPSTDNFLNFDCVIVNNPSIRTLSIENITGKSLVLGFNTSMLEELGIYQLRDELQSEAGDDTSSTVSEGSEEDGHESRRRAYAALVNKEKILETLEESQPRLSKAIVDSAPFLVQQGQKRAMPPKRPFTTSEKKTRMRMCLDLATSSFTSNGGDKTPGLGQSVPRSMTGEGELNSESRVAAKPFGVSGEDHAPRFLKRVQSSALLSAIEEGQNVVSETGQEEVSHEGIEEVLMRLGNHVISNSSFSDEEGEKQYVENQIKDRDLLMHVLEDLPRTLTPVRKLELLPGETKMLYVLLNVNGQTRSSLQGKLQQLTAKVNIQLLEWDKERQELLEGGFLEHIMDEDLLTRELPVHFRICRALLSLAQKNISFGKLLTNEHRAKTLVLMNHSDVPLLYKLKKTGSIASGDLHIINGRSGVLQPHSGREVNFVFQPSLGGSFRETLVVSNVYDPGNDQVVTLKATISRADTFWLNTSSIDFGAVQAGIWSTPESVVIVNNSKQSRTFTLKVADSGCDERMSKSMNNLSEASLPVLRFVVEEKRKRSSQGTLAPEQELIDSLERKGLAFERKGKADKAAKVRKQINELRAQISSAVSTGKEIESTSAEIHKEENGHSTSDTASRLNHSRLDVNFQGTGQDLGRKSSSLSKASVGHVSLSLKGGDSKTVLVSILMSSSAPTPMNQRIGGTLVAYESKNQDNVKKVHYEATLLQDAALEDMPVTLHSKPFNLKLQTMTPGVSCHPLMAPSPSLSPESSTPTSPLAGDTPQSAAIQSLFRSSSPDLCSSASPFDGSILTRDQVGGGSSASRNLATSFNHVLSGDQWGSKNHILQWGEEGEGLTPTDNVSEGIGLDEDDGSRSESYSGLFGLEPLFKIDLLQSSQDQAVRLLEQRDGDDDMGMDLSSAAALARSLASHKDQELAKAFFVGELILEDSPDHDRREGSFAIRSVAPQDIWIQLHLAWDGEPDSVDLWVGNLDDGIGSYVEGGNLAIFSAHLNPRKLRWEKPEASDYSTVDNIFVSSLLLKSGTVSVVTLTRPDESLELNMLACHSNLSGVEGSRVPGAYERKTQATGVLTMQARPDDGLSQQLLVHVKQLERCIKVVPSSIVFPESDLNTVLIQDLIIKNRTGSTLTFTARVTGWKKKLSSDNIVRLTDLSSASSGEIMAEGLVPASNDSVMCVSPVCGQIEGHASVTMKVTGRPVKPGKQMYSVHLQSSSCLSETHVDISMLPTRVLCLHLPDLPDGSALDMGFCFINAPSCEKVVPLRLQNLASESLLLSFRSNLAKQVYISTSSQGLKRTDELHLTGRAHTTVFMCLRPSGDATAFEGGQCREIIGGMRITARSISTDVGGVGSSSQEKAVDEIMVKFRAVVGRSLLQVSTPMIDLGRVTEVGGFVTGDFLVSNPSTQMPLHFSLTSKKAVLSVPEGRLVGKEAARINGSFGKSDMTVKFSLPVIAYGLIEDKVVVQNLSCLGQTAEVVLRLFVDGGLVEANPEPSLSHCHYKQDSTFTLPGLDSHPAEKSRLTNGKISTNLESSVHVLPLSPTNEAGIEQAVSRQIRKTLSAGDFFFASLTRSFGKADGLTDRQVKRFGGFGCEDGVLLEPNSVLDLGTVFISPVHKRTISAGSYTLESLEVSDYSISDLRPYHSSLVIRNHLQERIYLQPFSNLPVLVDTQNNLSAAYEVGRKEEYSANVSQIAMSTVRDETLGGIEVVEAYNKSQFGDKVYEELIRGDLSELVTNLAPCGGGFVVEPFSITRIFVSFLDLGRLWLSDIDRLSAGKLSKIEGLLTFVKVQSSFTGRSKDILLATHPSDQVNIAHDTVEVLNIMASICVSRGKLAKRHVELGKVGYANRWADVEFEITVENTSDAILVYQLVDVPEFFSISTKELHKGFQENEKRSYVPARSSRTLSITLCTSKLEHVKEAGLCTWQICLRNCNNPNNLMELVVEAELTVCTLRLGGLTESTLLLPPLTLPPLPNAPPCITQFVVENLSLEPLGVALQLQQAEETESLVMLEVVSPTNTTIGELTLEPGEKTELRICARPISDNIPSHFLVQHVTYRRPSRVGSEDAINIKCSDKIVPDIVKDIDEAGINCQEIGLANGRMYPDLDADHISHGGSEIANTVCMGQLYLFSSPHLPDCIPIHGALLQGSPFDVSPRTLHLQARMADEEIRPRTGNPDDTEHANKLTIGWEGRHDLVGSSQIVVIRNFRAFQSLQFSVLPSGLHQDPQAKLPFDYVVVQPLEGSIPPHGSVEILVKSRPWSRDVYDSVLGASGGDDLDPEPLAIILVVHDVESQKPDRSSERIVVRIRPPAKSQELTLEGGKKSSEVRFRELSFDEKVVKEASRAGQGFPLVLGLRGCTPVGGSLLCYEFNLGQQNISSGGHLNWDLTLVGDKAWPIHYRLCTITGGDASWLSISSPSGLVEAAQQKIVQLSFSTKAMGVYSTYLVVENLENPADLKTVHLSLEVVAPRNARPEAPSLTFFHVLVQGDRSEVKIIDMGEVYYNFWYRNRSFAVVNEAPVAMEFLLSSSLDHNESTELNFSLANTSLKRFSSITLGAKSSLRIWIHFCPGPAKKRPITEDTCDEMSANIFVNCRLIKDYQQCIPFRAKCRYPQIGISTTDIVFSARRQAQGINFNWAPELNGDCAADNGPVNAPLIESVAVVGSTGVQNFMPIPEEIANHSGCGKVNEDPPIKAMKSASLTGPVGKLHRDDDIELLPPLQMLVIRNLYAHRSLQYVVKNDSQFFAADYPEAQIVPCASFNSQNLIREETGDKNNLSESFHVIVVRPNLESLRVHQKTILKQKYVEEHLTIYNLSNPREKYTVSLRITAGHLRNFFAAPGRKNSYPFNRLELLITCFLSSFYSLTSHVLAGLTSGNFQTGMQVDMKKGKGRTEDGGLGPRPLVRQQVRNRLNEAKFHALEECLQCLRTSNHASTDYETLYFEFHYLTDELVFYCLKERWSRGAATLELATVQLSKLLYCALHRCEIFQVCLDSCQYFSSLGKARSPTPEDQIHEDSRVVTELYSSEVEDRARNVDHQSRTYSDLGNADAIAPPEQSLKFLQEWTGQLSHFLSFFPDSREDLIPLRELNQKNQDIIIGCRSALGREIHSFLYNR